MASKPRRTPESYVLRAVLDLLQAERIPHWRMNTGAFAGEHNGRKRFVRFGTPGMADVLAIPTILVDCHHIAEIEQLAGRKRSGAYHAYTSPLWIECKAPGGKQSADQQDFEAYVTANGMSYLLVDNVDTLRDWLKVRL